VLVAPARAQDPIAPRGAPPTWLPRREWVLNHFLPYDSATLHAAIGTGDTGLRSYFGGQEHRVVPPVAELARRRGVASDRLVRMLIRPWRGTVSRRHLGRLRRRTTLTLSQGHLLQHMLFHPLHEKALMEAEPDILGTDHTAVASLRRAGASNLEIGARFGRTEHQITAAAVAVLRGTMRRAVRRRWTPRAQARRYLRFQIGEIPAWLTFARRDAAPHRENESPGHGTGAGAIAQLRGAWAAEPFFCANPTGRRVRAAG
jgi:hypothetical protein